MPPSAFRVAVAAACLAAGLALAGPARAEDDPVLATVNGTDIHRSDLAAAQARIPQARSMPLEAVLPNLLDWEIDQRVLQEAADKAGLETAPEVVENLAQIKKELVKRLYLERRVDERIGDAELKEAYDAFVKANPPAPEVHARHILVDTEEAARKIITRLKDGEDFEALAKTESIGPSGPRGGDLGYFAKDAMVPEFAEAAFAMKPGEMSKDPVKTQFGWHVIKVEDRRVPEPASFEDMKDELYARMAEKEARAVIADLRGKAEVTIHKDALPPAADADADAAGKN
jgi:peptidyl-prolyl cis-trans isomerase C